MGRSYTLRNSDNFTGLNISGRKLIKDHLKKEKSGEFRSRWATNDSGPLYKYTLLDGRVVQEVLQTVVVDEYIGDCYYIALKDVVTGKYVPETKWTEEQIDEFE